MSQQLPDVYTNSDIDNFPGARERSRPGEGDREETYPMTHDAKGNPVSSKPANQGVLASQRKRLEHERKLADLASRPPSGSFSRYTPLLLIFLFLPLLSSFLTGTSYTFHLAPHVVPPVSKWWRLSSINPNRSTLRTFTPHQLSRYDGKREDRPLYIALAGDVYDVSANRRIYGPGGSYSMMAGRDVSRAYITGCFKTDLTHDLRGLSKNDLQALENWKKFFASHEQYRLVGHVKNPPIDPNSPIPPDCRKDEDGTQGEEEQTHAGKKAGHGKPGPVKATGS